MLSTAKIEKCSQVCVKILLKMVPTRGKISVFCTKTSEKVDFYTKNTLCLYLSSKYIGLFQKDYFVWRMPNLLCELLSQVYKMLNLSFVLMPDFKNGF